MEFITFMQGYPEFWVALGAVVAVVVAHGIADRW